MLSGLPLAVASGRGPGTALATVGTAAAIAAAPTPFRKLRRVAKVVGFATGIERRL